jgi:hypothetical protein
MSFRFSPSIITDGLVLYLDAANTKSYVSGSTTWSDLSRSENNGTIVNGPTFDSADGGSIVFDGVNDKITIPNSSSLNLNSTLTLCFFIKKNTNIRMYYVDKHLSGADGYFGYIDSTNLVFFRFGLNSIQTNTNLINNNQWYYISIVGGPTLRSIYINGVESISTSGTNTWNTSTEPFIFGNTSTNEGSINGNISLIQLYNRTLTAQEILQNYNTVRSRFRL